MAPEFQERNPYVGPRPFGWQDRDLFFGRDREVHDVLSLVIAHRVLLLYAQAGAGKTSLLNAGLIPLLEEEGFEVLPLPRVRGLSPERIEPEKTNLYVFNTLMSWAEDKSAIRRLAQMSLGRFLREGEHPTDEMGLPSPRVVIFDQFEELFTFYPERWRDREGFFEQVRDALEEDPLLWVVFVIREDYIAQLDPYAPFLPDGLRTRFRLERMRERAALSAATGPLAHTGCSFAEGVAEQLVEELLKVRVETAAGKTEVATGEFVEPVQLQVVCQSLWRDLPPDATLITRDHLQAFGDVNQALSGFYERSIKRATQEAGVREGDLRAWFEHSLVTPAGTRSMVYRGREKTGGMPNAVVDVLESLHVVRGEWRAGARWYELTHDRFIGPIQRSNEAWRAARRQRWLQIAAGAMVSLILLVFLVLLGMRGWEQSQALALQATVVAQETAAAQAEATVAAQETAAAQAEATATARAQKGAEALSFLSDQSISQGDYIQAIVDCTQAIELVPDFAEAYYKRGFVYTYYLDEYEKAIADYDRAIELDPEHKWAYEGKGYVLRELGRYDEALAALDQAIQLDPEFAWAYEKRGRVYSDREEYERAIEEYDKAIELDPEHKWAYMNKGDALRELGRYGEALAALDQAIQPDPEFAWAYEKRGRVYSDREEYEQAIEEYDKAIKLDPEHKWAYEGKGYALRELGRYDEALAALNQAIQLDPEFAWAYYGKGYALRELGRYDEALAALNQAIQLDPEFDWAYYERGRVYSEREEHERTIEECDKFIELNPGFKWAYGLKGHALRELGRYDEALAALDQAIQLDPEFAWAYYERGRVYSDREEYERAIQEYDKAIELDAEYADTYFNRGLAYKLFREQEKAIADFEKYLELSKDEDLRSQAEQYLRELRGQ